MSARKKAIRRLFREAVFLRDSYRCRMCGFDGKRGRARLDAHHITPREDMPGGGYVVLNGISLCPSCHLRAEEHLKPPEFRSIGLHPGYAPEDLYESIGSSYEKALEASKRADRKPRSDR